MLQNISQDACREAYNVLYEETDGKPVSTDRAIQIISKSYLNITEEHSKEILGKLSQAFCINISDGLVSTIDED